MVLADSGRRQTLPRRGRQCEQVKATRLAALAHQPEPRVSMTLDIHTAIIAPCAS